MIEAIGNIFSVFGGIFLIMSIISYITMQKKVINPNCKEDVDAVKFNKKYGKVILITNIVIVLIGLICLGIAYL